MASALAGYEKERSARINQVCADWRDLIAASVPVLTEAQWCAVIDAINGTMIDDDTTMRHLWAEVADAREICEKWSIDQASIVAALRALTWAELVALRETVRRYWLSVEAGAQSHGEALRQAGARIGVSDAAAG